MQYLNERKYKITQNYVCRRQCAEKSYKQTVSSLYFNSINQMQL